MTASTDNLPLIRFVKTIWRYTRGTIVLTLCLSAFTSILALLQLVMLKFIVDGIYTSVETTSGTTAIKRVLLPMVIIGGIQLIRVFVRTLSRYAGQKQLLVIQDKLQHDMNTHSANLSLEYYEQAGSKDIIHRAQREAGYRPATIIRNLNGLIQSFFNLLLAGGLLVYLNWPIALLLMVSMIPHFFVRLRNSDAVYALERSQTTNERLSRYYAWMVTTESYAKDIRLYHLGKLFSDRYSAIRELLRNARLRLEQTNLAKESLAQLFSVVVLLGSFAWLLLQTSSNTLTIGSLALFTGAALRGYDAIKGGTLNTASIIENNRFLTNLFEFFDLEPGIKGNTNTKDVKSSGLELHDLSFTYPGQTKPALEHLNLRIEPGETVALVGPNGSGKTTLIKLICRLYDPTDGTITMGDVDIKTLIPEEYRKSLGVVFQDYSQFHLSASENISLGKAFEQVPLEVIREAAVRAGVDELIESLPDGYDTILGNWFEGSRPLSIGEWQKVALARALLRESPLLIMDEPTSAIDIHAENEFYTQFARIVRGRTVLIASHRLKTVTMADRIILMERGRIIADGDHSVLEKYGYSTNQSNVQSSFSQEL